MPRKERVGSRAKQLDAQKRAAARVALPAQTDVCVLGGGAAGLVAGIVAAEAGAQVVVLERTLECGRTILATGNGRCNFANAHLEPGLYNDPTFVAATCGTTWLNDVLSFFGDCGLAWSEEAEGRLYPLSRQAASVRNVLLLRAREAGVVLAPGREIYAVEPARNGFAISFTEEFGELNEGALAARAVIVASGGSSRLSQNLGLSATSPSPLLCPLACDSALLKELDGIRVKAQATLVRNGTTVASEIGEVLFRDYGLSGIAVFNLSRYAQAGDKIVLDLAPSLSPNEVQRLGAHTLDGILDPVLAHAIERHAGSRTAVLAQIKNLSFEVRSLTQTTRAQVHRGGLATSSFDPATLRCTSLPGLFACGEALDVDGPCGGYNLAWAWKSGMVAGSHAAKEAKND